MKVGGGKESYISGNKKHCVGLSALWLQNEQNSSTAWSLIGPARRTRRTHQVFI